MSGRGKKDENDGDGGGDGGDGGDGGGGWSTFWTVAAVIAGAAAVVAGSMYSIPKPKKGWLKLNVDGSCLRKIPSAGCGGVLRNDSEKWVKGFAQKLDPSLREDQTEKEGILKGLEWAKKKRVRKVEVESDNKVIVDMVNDGNEANKDGYIVAIRELLVPTHDWQATLRWIPKSANGVAHELADIASRKLTSFDLKEFDSPPESCLKALAKDSPHLY